MSLARRRSASDIAAMRADPLLLEAFLSRGVRGMVDEIRRQNAHLNEFSKNLPLLTEQEVRTLGHADSSCPICLVPLLALLAEEENALAMDSPALSPENLGVTRLVNTCGHIFCRKDIRCWIREGHTTCPSCRQPFVKDPLPPSPSPETETGSASADEELTRQSRNLFLPDYEDSADFMRFMMPQEASGAAVDEEVHDDRDRAEIFHSGMYS